MRCYGNVDKQFDSFASNKMIIIVVSDVVNTDGQPFSMWSVVEEVNTAKGRLGQNIMQNQRIKTRS
jgi:hypothetical protein